MDQPRAPVAFLHATIDKPNAVVGEQVTLSVYLYEDPYSRQGRPGDVHEATANDFVKRSLMEDETRAVGAGTALVGGKLWNVKLVRKNALFPLKTGRLGDRADVADAAAGTRRSARERDALRRRRASRRSPGRPAGYAVGDIGDFALQATVTPRAIERDGAIGVTVELRGTGNLPVVARGAGGAGRRVARAARRATSSARSRNDRFGGTRTFSYVVRVHKEGAVDLGEVRLPYYDPDKRTYAIARADDRDRERGDGSRRATPASTSRRWCSPTCRRSDACSRARTRESYVTERPVYWAALFGSPLACALALGAHGVVGRWRERRASASPSAEHIAKTRRAEAEDAVRGDDGKAAIGRDRPRGRGRGAREGGREPARRGRGDTAKTELEDAGVSAAKARRAWSRSFVVARTCASRPTASTSRRRARRGSEREGCARRARCRAAGAVTVAGASRRDEARVGDAGGRARAGDRDGGGETDAGAARARTRANATRARTRARRVRREGGGGGRDGSRGALSRRDRCARRRSTGRGDRQARGARRSRHRRCRSSATTAASRTRVACAPAPSSRAISGARHTASRRRASCRTIAALVADATTALEAVRAEVAHRRSRAGDPIELEHGVSLGRSIVKLLAGERVGDPRRRLLARARGGHRLRATRRDAAPAASPARRPARSRAVCSSFASRLEAARDVRLHVRDAVVIAPSTRLLDDKHVALHLGRAALPEGARVQLLDEGAGLRARLGGSRGRLAAGRDAVLPMAKR